MRAKIIILFLFFFSSYKVKSQNIDIYLNQYDCATCTQQLGKVLKLNDKTQIKFIVNTGNKELIRSYINHLGLNDSHYTIEKNDSLYQAELEKLEYKSFIKIIFNDRVLGRFRFESLKKQESLDKLENIINSLHHPLFHSENKWAVSYPTLDSLGYYHVNDFLQQLEYYTYAKDSNVFYQKIKYSSIEDTVLQLAYPQAKYKKIKSWTKSKRTLSPGWGKMYLFKCNTSNDTCYSGYLFLHITDSIDYQVNLISGLLSFFHGSLVNISVNLNKSVLNNYFWPRPQCLIIGSHTKYFRIQNTSPDTTVPNLGYFKGANKIGFVPVSYNDSLYPSHCSANLSGNYKQSCGYLANQETPLELIRISDFSSFEINWDSSANFLISQFQNDCQQIKVIDFKNRSMDFSFVIVHIQENQRTFYFAQNSNEESKVHRISEDPRFNFYRFFNDHLIMALDKEKLNWVPLAIY